MIIDSELTFEEAIQGSTAPSDIIETLALIDIVYIGFDGEEHQGQLVVSNELADEVKEIFSILHKEKFPIEKMIPIVRYGWRDDDSMKDNNTSAFNYRLVAGTNRVSNHSFGRAIDINPKVNPYIGVDKVSQPPGATYDPKRQGVIIDGRMVVSSFLQFGWEWGGHWMAARGYIDYQHFQKSQ